MQLLHSALNMRYALFSDASQVQNPDIDAHMKQWADAGFELVTVTERSRDGGSYVEDTLTFFWRRAT